MLLDCNSIAPKYPPNLGNSLTSHQFTKILFKTVFDVFEESFGLENHVETKDQKGNRKMYEAVKNKQLMEKLKYKYE